MHKLNLLNAGLELISWETGRWMRFESGKLSKMSSKCNQVWENLKYEEKWRTLLISYELHKKQAKIRVSIVKIIKRYWIWSNIEIEAKKWRNINLSRSQGK